MARHYGKTRKTGNITALLFGFSLFYVLPSALSSPPSREVRRSIPEFDGTSAFTFLYKQVEFGPRTAGSDGHKRAQDAYIAWFDTCGGIVREQDFTAEIGGEYVIRDTKVSGKNIIAYFGPQSDRSDFIIAASYDSSPITRVGADSYSLEPPPGANHNASGVAVILELARLFAITPPKVSVELVLFDLSVQIYDPFIDKNKKEKGCEYYAINHSGKKPEVMIVLENVGYESLEIQMNSYCWKNHQELNEKIFDRAQERELSAFDKTRGKRINLYDPHSHYILIKSGFPVCYLSNNTNPYFLEPDDLPVTCSSNSLKQVGDLLVDLIYRELNK